MYKVGLTGGIGSGKSTVAQLFAEFKVRIIDADAVAHALTAPGQPAVSRIIDAFGPLFLTAEGALDRRRLRELIFSDAEQKQRLEAILHPMIFAAMEQQATHSNDTYVILAVPLLFETNRARSVDRVLVVDCPVDLQISRVIARDQQSPDNIQAIIQQQISRADRCAQADDIIDNGNTSPHELAERVKTLHNLYKLLASNHQPSQPNVV